jgi:hypothetical protein
MRKAATCFLLVFCLFCAKAITISAQTSSNTNQSANNLDTQSEKIKKKIEKIGQGNDITIFLNDGREFYGLVKSIESDLVLIFEVDVNKLLEFKYADIKKASKGYREIGRDGTRRKPSRKSKLLAAAILGFVVVFNLVGYSKK